MVLEATNSVEFKSLSCAPEDKNVEVINGKLKLRTKGLHQTLQDLESDSIKFNGEDLLLGNLAGIGKFELNGFSSTIEMKLNGAGRQTDIRDGKTTIKTHPDKPSHLHGDSKGIIDLYFVCDLNSVIMGTSDLVANKWN